MKVVTMLVVVLIVLGGLGVALGADIERTGAGGDWSNASQWDLNRVPESTDNVIHGTMASGLLTFDEDVDPANEDINDFQAVAGGSRGLLFEEDTTLMIANDFERTGTGAYVTELLAGSSLTVGGTIIEGNWIVGDSATVTTDAITISENTDWEVNNNGSVIVDNDIDFVDVDPNTVSLFTVNSGGELLVGGSAFFESLTIEAGGGVDITGSMDANDVVMVRGGTLTAASAGTTGTAPCLGEIWIRNGGTVTVDGEVRVRSNANVVDKIFYGSGSLTAGYLNFASANSWLEALTVGQDLDVTVSGDIDIVTSRSAGQIPRIQWRFVTLTLNGSSAQNVEVFTPDFDIDPNGILVVWQGLHLCGDEMIYNVEPMAGLILESGATVNLTDENENILRGTGSLYPQDALYVDGDINVPSGATLNANKPVYYTGSRLGTGTINGTAVQVTKVCFGDFDADGDVDLDDFAVFSAAFSGENNESSNPLCSGDLDGDVALSDYGKFSQNFTGANNPCPTTCGESSSGGGEWTVESLAEWSVGHLTSAQIESFAETLYALAEAAGETQDAADMAELAYLITAE